MIDRCDLAVIKFGEKYKQGTPLSMLVFVALDKPYITLHNQEHPSVERSRRAAMA